MFNTTEIEELADRKRLLVAESELHRQTLVTEYARLQNSIVGMQAVVESGNSVYRIASSIASLVGGLFLERKKENGSGWLKTALFGWQMAARLKPFWTAFRRGQRTGSEGTPQ